MLKINSDDIVTFKEEHFVEESELDVDQMKSILEIMTGEQLSFADISLFGNGKIIHEQVYDKNSLNGEESVGVKVDANL